VIDSGWGWVVDNGWVGSSGVCDMVGGWVDDGWVGSNGVCNTVGGGKREEREKSERGGGGFCARLKIGEGFPMLERRVGWRGGGGVTQDGSSNGL
jgi:hypothetical protein